MAIDELSPLSAALNGDQENYFGAFLNPNINPSLTLTLRNIETTSAGTAQGGLDRPASPGPGDAHRR